MSRSPTYRSPNLRNTGLRSDSSNPGASGSESNERQQQQTTSGAEAEEQRRGACYTMIPPKEEKRSKLLEVSRKEEEQYQARLQARRSRLITEAPRTLGGQESHSAAINRKAKEAALASSNKYLHLQEKREKYARQKKEEENKQNEEKKAKARAQAERNKQREVERGLRLQEEHRRKNSAFLDRLDSSSAHASYCSSRTAEEDFQGRVRRPVRSAVPPRQTALQYLSSLYPEYDTSALAAILEGAGGSVERAKTLLSQTF